MYKDAFIKLDVEEVAVILEKLNPEFNGTVFDSSQTTILAQDISFYEGFRFLDIADYSSVPPLRRFVIYGADKFSILNWNNEPIYKMNQDVPITLTKNNVIDYVRFFFTYVRGRHGRFMIIENIDDINWNNDPVPEARRTIGKMLMPITFESIDESETFYLKMCVLFKDSLFKTDVKIEKGGFVRLENEELLVEDLPVLDDIFGQ